MAGTHLLTPEGCKAESQSTEERSSGCEDNLQSRSLMDGRPESVFACLMSGSVYDSSLDLLEVTFEELRSDV